MNNVNRHILWCLLAFVLHYAKGISMRVLLMLLMMAVGSSHAAVEVDWVKVDKSKRRLYLISGDQVLREYRIALGKQPKGHKVQEGDQRTPEGVYTLDYITEDSTYYRSVHISYPNWDDVKVAKQLGVSPGGEIKIHGLRNGEQRDPKFVQSFDWTNGCIALTNTEMDEFIRLVKMGTPIHIEW